MEKASIFAYGLCIAGVNKQHYQPNVACLANKVLLEHSHLIHVCVVYGYFHTTMEEMNHLERDGEAYQV